MHVLRRIHRAVRAGGWALDFHPLGEEFAVRAGKRGLGFIDTRAFARVLAAMNDGVQVVVDEGLFSEVRNLRRHVVERFDTAQEALEEADSWDYLRLPWLLRRRLRRSRDTPVEFVDTIRYRLLRRL